MERMLVNSEMSGCDKSKIPEALTFESSKLRE